MFRSVIDFVAVDFAGFLHSRRPPGWPCAQDRRQNAPGEFDYYVLALSWSPSFCEAAAERGNSGRSKAQCGRPYLLRGSRPVAAI